MWPLTPKTYFRDYWRKKRMNEAVIVTAQRTAIGSFGGVFKDVSAVSLGSAVVKASLKKINLNPNLIDEVIIGNVLSAGLGQNVARQVAIGAGIPKEVPAFTVNKVCGSGLKTVVLAAQSILSGDNEIVVAGGTENMSQAPYLSPTARFGARMGDKTLVDSLLKDALIDAFSDIHMGITAENVADKYGITRKEQDELAARSQQNAEKAIKNGRFNDEIVPIEVLQRKGEPIVVNTDEFPRFGTTVEGISKLRPAFKKDGTVSAANASGINDGAAVVIVMSRKMAEKLGLKPLAVIKGYASAGVEPKIMGCGPIAATEKLLDKLKLKVSDLDLIEANEAFASQAIGVIKNLDMSLEKVNVNGGSIALGHPVGASGSRILVTLLHEMQKNKDVKLGLATLCIGGGQGISMIVEKL